MNHQSGGKNIYRISGESKNIAETFERIYRLYYVKLCYYAYSFVHDKDNAKDIVHDVFFALWQKRDELEQIMSISVYLYRAVKNKSLDFLKHDNLNISMTEYEELIEMPGSQNVIHELEGKEASEIINKIVNELPSRCREVFHLVKYQGLKYSETAELLGISINTVENQMVKSLNYLREKLS